MILILMQTKQGCAVNKLRLTIKCIRNKSSFVVLHLIYASDIKDELVI